MSVYVDRAIWKLGRMTMCHMLADSTDELHEMAAKIAIQRRWFQGDRYPHYDICKAKREKAISLGAVPIGRRQFVSIARGQMQRIDLLKKQEIPQ